MILFSGVRTALRWAISAALFSLSGCWCFLQAQVSLTLYRPDEISLATAEIWNCDLVNLGNQPVDGYLYGIVTEESRGVVLETRSADFTLATSYSFNTGNYEILKPEQTYQYNEQFREYVFRTGTVPNGSYTICLRFYNTAGTEILATQCLSFDVDNRTPPALIAPGFGEKVCEPLPFFIWSPYRPWEDGGQMEYRLFIHQVLDHQSAVAAVRDNPSWYEASMIQGPMFQYPWTGLQWTHGATYAWYVGVYAFNQEISRSDIFTFTWENCGLAESEEEEVAEEAASNAAKKGLHYYDLSRALEGDLAMVAKGRLNVILTSGSTGEQVYYTVQQPNGASAGSGPLDLHRGRNYFDLDVAAWNLQPGTIYHLLITRTNGTTQRIRFMLPQS